VHSTCRSSFVSLCCLVAYLYSDTNIIICVNLMALFFFAERIYFDMFLSTVPFFALGCICTLYLKCIFDIFENVKKIQTKMFFVHLHVLRAHEAVSRKSNFLLDLCKNDKIWY
jgi:hypothetical protein